MMRRRLAACWILIALASGTVAGAEERPRIAATRATAPIHIDGVMNEADWAGAPPLRAFGLLYVREGEAPSESTDVRVLFDDANVYFGMRCENRSPGPIRASLAPRDQITDGDFIAIHLDTYNDRHRAYIIGVNPYGVQLDGILDGSEPDFSWDGVWHAETTRDSAGWTAEVGVPLRSLRFPNRGDGTWGLWLRREITKNGEICSWPVYREANQGDVMLQAADLTGLDGLQGSGGIEVQPYVAGARFSTREISPTTTEWDNTDDSSVGLDAKVPIRSDLTADFTVNPDFSQIEADALQIDVNRRFPLFFTEKRPFFLEGAEIFTTPFNLVYTRRIADPSYGGKLTGKSGPWRLGAIAVRDDGGGSTDGIGGRAEGDFGQGAFGIARLRRDLGENGHVGLVLTEHLSDRKGLAAGTGLGPPSYVVNGGQNTVAAVDGRLRFAKNWFVSGQLGGSWSRIDRSRTNGSGPDRLREDFSDVLYTTNAWFADGTTYAVGYHDYLGPDFRTEAGFLDRVDARISGYEATYTFRPKAGPLRTWQPQTNGNLIHDSRGILQERRLAGAVEWSFHRQTRMHTRYARVIERWLTRDYDRNRYIFELENTAWRPLSFELFVTLEDGIFFGPTDAESFLGGQESYQLIATARPSPRLTSEITATRNRFSHGWGGPEVYDVLVVGAKTTYQFSRSLYARFYPQIDADAHHVDLDALVGYVLHPGSVLYLGVNGDLDKSVSYRQTGRTIFLKASYLFQL
jgi:hypothetical protein